MNGGNFEDISALRKSATESLQRRGIPRPDPNQVVAEMKKIKSEQNGDWMSQFAKLFGGAK
jgi:hypothetical protein